MMAKMTVWVSLTDVAAQFDVDKRTVRKWASSGILHPIRTSRRGKFLVRRTEVDTLAHRLARDPRRN
jgi:excisionase family DNA binding protein